MPAEASSIFRKLSYVAIIISDILDRIVWRVRPYELRPGLTDSFMEKALQAAVAEVEQNGASLEFKRLFDIVEDTASTAKTFIDTRQPRRPLIGIIGEIYVRTHPESNQHIARVLEQLGGEVVVASVAEWINYITYDIAREHKRHLKLALLKRDFASLRGILNNLISTQIEKYYQLVRQRQVYSRALKYIDIQKDHRIAVLEKRLDRDRLFSFDIGTESALSIGAALEQSHEGYNGVVNVFPFTCMPSAVCTAVLKPLLNKMRMPYIDAPYDGAIQPNREIALRTFMYQAKQHLESRNSDNRTARQEMSYQTMIINAVHPEEFRIAVVEGHTLESFFIETATRGKVAGNIYKGIITHIQSSLQAAFVNYGAERNGFLPFSEIHPEYYDSDVPRIMPKSRM